MLDYGKILYELHCANASRHAGPAISPERWETLTENVKQTWRDTAEDFKRYLRFGK